MSTQTTSQATTTTTGTSMFFSPDSGTWRDLSLVISAADETEKQKLVTAARAANEELKTLLLSSLQMQHIVALAGSGTSLGTVTRGPSMATLWDFCVNSNPGTGDEDRKLMPKVQKVVKEVGYVMADEQRNIEALLSRCEAFLQVRASTAVEAFVKQAKKVILEKCSEFLDPSDNDQLAAHRTFLHRLSRRRTRDSRLKLFTTNYDLCFEAAAGRQGLVAVDGFSFTQPRHFDARFFSYDIVRHPAAGDEVGTPLEGVFHLYKLHGSVDWSRTEDGEIEIVDKPKPENACLIYPARGKYQQSYIQPHLELIAQYFSVLRQPNTCLIIIGYGFNDDHLSEPILAAVRTNPHLRLIIVNPSAAHHASEPGENKHWDALFDLAKKGEDVWLLNTPFAEFAEMIPDLKSLTPAEQLTRSIKKLAAQK